ncbi:MAG: PLP-dependent aspartate aminotransferase family protein [Acidobacteriota bacterium]
MSEPKRRLHPETIAIHSAAKRPETGDVMPPIHLSTTFVRAPDGSYPSGFDYIRSGNPGREELETCLSELEIAEVAVATPSGMAATHAVFSALDPGDRVLVPLDTYYGTKNLLHTHFERWGLEVESIDMSSPTVIERALERRTRLIWLETPSNPCITITDLGHAIAAAQRHGTLVACDNTWATPVLQRPLELGADIVVHSTTKYIAGHSDAMGGAVLFRERSETAERVREAQTEAGLTPAPFDCWLIRRGLYTLACRMKTHCENAQRLAEFLETQDGVERVHFPGLASDPGHEVAKRQMSDFGGMLSFVVHGGRERAFDLVNSLSIARPATSLGGPETLIEHRASIEGEGTQAPEGLLRVSVGLEHPEDLTADFGEALAASTA